MTCVALFSGATPRALAQDTTAAELLQQGITLMEAGDSQAAKEVLEQIDAIALSKEQRQALYAALTDIETTLAEAPAEPAAPAATEVAEAPAETEAPAEAGPTAAEVLAQADAAAEADPGTAIALYTSLIEDGGSEAQTAQARMADLLRELNADVTQAKRTLDSAEADLAAGRFELAQDKFAAVTASGVELGWFDEQRIARGNERIAEAGVAAEATAVAEAPAEPEPAAEPAVEVTPAVAVAPAPAASPSLNAESDLIVQARKAVANEYYVDAQAAMEQGYDALAINLLSQADELDPNNPAIEASLAQATATAGNNIQLTNQVDNFKLRRDAAQAAYDESMTKAQGKLEAGDYAGAGNDVAAAKNTIENNQEFFSVSEFEKRRDAATELSKTINQQQIAAAIKADEDARKKAEIDNAEALKRAKKQNAQEVRELIIKARQFQKEMKYEDALLLLERALFIEPNNFTAQLLKEVIEDSQVAVNYTKIERARRLEGARDHLLNREAIIPYTDLVTFPEDWPELSDRRIRGLDDTGGESEANRETALRLKKTVPISFDANPLESVIDYLRETTGANIFVNWPALIDSGGIEQDQPISLTLNNVPAEKALELVLQQASSTGFGDPIDYSIIDGVVTISTAEDLKRSTDLRVYDIRDLLVQVPSFTDAPEFDLTEALSNTNSGGGGGGGGGDSIFGDDEDDEDDEEEVTRAELIQQITQLIEETVGQFEDWEIEGGESTVRELNSNLIIKTTPDNHRQINDLLALLRETRAIQISVEARYLLVDRNFLESVAVDFDLAWVGGQEADGTGFQPVALDQNSAGQGGTGIAAPVIDALSYEPFFAVDPALGLGVSFIDDLSVNLLVEATLANRNSISLTAPRVTFFNGQRAYVVVARQIAFVSDLEPIPDAAGFDVTVSVTQSGVVLDVEGTISADRRYVTLTLRPSLADVAEIDEFRVIGIIDDDDDDDGIDTSGVFEGFIQLPVLDITTVRATVSVPDRGTLLVGGQRLVGETEVEAGVPVLSKIPVLNRLFTNSSKVEDERTLLILIKPTIIIQNEREEDAFPGISENLKELGANLN
ncbi:hypothetical protein [Algisphaera agarilytica]|uniref:hypothetical protein n=1 Tax=Algisphaera agarilytica TaxID=1385975 RepID=UPI001C883790|nr:hypothetical protein [Algisphaera agarilytica]